jgi:hypothetical protein
MAVIDARTPGEINCLHCGMRFSSLAEFKEHECVERGQLEIGRKKDE